MRSTCVSIFFLLIASNRAAGTDQLPTPWSGQDIGAVSLPGSASFDQNVFTMSAAGTDIWGNADQFHFAYRQISGDVEIIARVDSVQALNTWVKAGVMIRASLDAGSAHGYALVSAAKGVAFQRRTQVNGVSTNTYGPLGHAPSWVRLLRVGSRVDAFTSPDGSTWTPIGSDTIALGTTVYVGLAVTSHAPAAASAQLSNVTVNSVGLLPSQNAADIGSPSVRGSTTQVGGTYTIAAGGADVWNAADQCHFVYQQVTGDIDVAVRVASIQGASTWVKAGVMIRESLSANSRNVYALISKAKGEAFQRRTDTGGLTVSALSPFGEAPGWVRLVRRGYQISAFWSADGTTWIPMGIDTVPMQDAVYVGMAVTAHASTGTAIATLDHYTLQQSAANTPPTVALTAPSDEATFLAPADITLTANAADPEDRLSHVEFFSGSTSLGVVSTVPYAITWSQVPAGTYTLNAVAHDAEGAGATSASATITIYGSDTLPTGVAFHASSDHASPDLTGYLLEIFPIGADPGIATPVASSNLGKPTPDADGNIAVNLAPLFDALRGGIYVATISSVGAGGPSRSAPVTFVR